MAFTADKLQLRPMTQKDITLGMKLKSLAKWNQLQPDWELLIKATDKGNFVASYEEEDIATVTTITYQDRFSWIGMVLVDPLYRGLGVGKSLLVKAIDTAKDKGTVRLDATLQGKKLYQALGFKTERELIRLERKTYTALLKPGQLPKPVVKEVLEEIIALDCKVFGADRGLVLRHFFQQVPQYSFYIETNDTITGYCFGRPGSDFEQIGPIVAASFSDARDLLLSAMASCRQKPVIVDVFTDNKQWLEVITSLGFNMQRPFTRMYLGKLDYPGKTNLQYAIAGPELG